MKHERLKQLALDIALCGSMLLGYLTWLLRTTNNLGYARDEGFYFQAADAYLLWFRQLPVLGRKALKQSVVDQYWQANHEHPALIKSLFAGSRYWLFDKWHLFARPGTAYRFVGMAFACLALATIYVWARRAIPCGSVLQSRYVASVAALAFALMPRIFYHSHLDCFDVPVLSMWFLTCYVYWESVRQRSFGLVLLTGVLYGLLLNTKHNSWLLPIALVAHLLLAHGRSLLGALKRGRVQVPPALFAMALLGPVVFFATWPWIWFDTVARLREYVLFHLAHVYYNMEFLGKTYFRPPFPRSYAWVMTAATVPSVTLLLASLGMWEALRGYFRATVLPAFSALRRARSAVVPTPSALPELQVSAESPVSAPTFDFASTQVLWLLGVFISYAPWLSERNPIFGGTKHWTTAYPFLALFAGVAFRNLCSALSAAWVARRGRTFPGMSQLVHALGAFCVLLAPLAITLNSHPWGLTSYTPLVGSAPGAATLGLNRTFWGYASGAVADSLNETAPNRAKTFIHDTAWASWQMMRADGSVRKDLRPQLEVAESDVAIYHHEQHMSLVEYQIWTDYGTTQPRAIGAFQGVPVVWTYQR